MGQHLPVALIVEDEMQIRRFVRMALETEGWQTFESETMRRGLIDSGTRKPDLIILDLGLPDGDGVDFILDLRKWSSVSIIVLSARTDEQDKIRALDVGADDYLTKPFGIGELLARGRNDLHDSRAVHVGRGAALSAGRRACVPRWRARPVRNDPAAASAHCEIASRAAIP